MLVGEYGVLSGRGEVVGCLANSEVVEAFEHFAAGRAHRIGF